MISMLAISSRYYSFRTSDNEIVKLDTNVCSQFLMIRKIISCKYFVDFYSFFSTNKLCVINKFFETLRCF